MSNISILTGLMPPSSPPPPFSTRSRPPTGLTAQQLLPRAAEETTSTPSPRLQDFVVKPGVSLGGEGGGRSSRRLGLLFPAPAAPAVAGNTVDPGRRPGEPRCPVPVHSPADTAGRSVAVPPAERELRRRVRVKDAVDGADVEEKAPAGLVVEEAKTGARGERGAGSYRRGVSRWAVCRGKRVPYPMSIERRRETPRCLIRSLFAQRTS